MIESRNFTDDDAEELSRLRELDFTECTFAKINFSEVILKSSLFSECKFIGCNFANCDLTNASFRDVHFDSCNLIGLNWVSLKRLANPTFTDCKLDFSTFQGLKLKWLQVINCSANEVDFSDSDLTESNFSGTLLAGASFNRTNLTKADFRSAKNYLIDARTAKIRGTKLSFPEALSLITIMGAEVDF